MQGLTIIQQDGGAYIDSREVAVLIDKQHKHLLRDIRSYCTVLERITEPKVGPSDFFLESSYLDSTGRTQPCYLLSKMGCEMVANKLIGVRGVLFTAAYVAKFNEMEAAERAELEALAAMPAPRLGEFNACARIIVRALRNMGATAEQILHFLKGVYEPLGITVAEDDEFNAVPQMYTAKQIAKLLGIYSHNGNPHYQAVACILNENIFIGDSHKYVETQDYGNLTSICVRYDDYAVQAVMEWLQECGYPDEVYGFDRTYRVLYKDSSSNRNIT